VELLIPVGDGEIWVQDTGGADVPVVFANSDWCDSSSWDRTAGLLAEHRLIRYDNRGYGRSPAPVAPFTQLGDPPAWPRLGEISVSAMVVLGELDYPVVTDCATAIAGRIPGCRTLIVPGADHLLPLRAPDLLADLIRSATASLSGHSAAPGA
jgi:pimeloyl-ACP methyl ester carboxylesterase